MDFWSVGIPEAFEHLRSSEQGLTSDEAKMRRATHGKNTLPRSESFGPWLFLWEQVKSPLIFILLIAGFITLGLKEYFDMIVIFASVAVNIGVGFYQEYNSSKILEHLQKLIRVNARVLRDGRITELDSSDLVPGDVVQLKIGMKVPADLRLIRVRDCSVDEAILTGESRAVEKSIEPLASELVISDRKNMAFMGTIVDRGEAWGVVGATGIATEIGKIAELTKRAEEAPTPLQERLASLGKIITIIVAIAAVAILVVGVVEQLDFVEIFITAVAVAVAAIPEGLPAALAVILAMSSKKILKSGGLVKKLIAAESLGSTSVICADKTGTLTEGTMKVKKLVTEAPQEKILTALAFANEAIIEGQGAERKLRGDSTDCAKLDALLDAGLSYDETIRAMPQIALVPFESSNKFVASFHRLDDNSVMLYVAGAPEVFIQHSARVLGAEDREFVAADTEKLRNDYETLAAQGFRMIGAGYRVLAVKPEDIENAPVDELIKEVGQLTFLGLAAIRDPIREDVKSIMTEVRSAGLKVVMITGDHRLTAVAIGKELGIVRSDNAVMEGVELDKLSDEELKHRIRDIDVFARVDPKHKLRVVEAWKSVGESVAATGDGVNDAPALKAADIGIAVASGTDVTKEAADLVLMNESFATIVEAIRQGRTAFYNIKKVTIFLLSNSFTELILILGALILRIPLPLTAIQILWTNLVEDGLPNFALAFEPPEKNVMRRKPLERRAPILDRLGKVLSFPVGIATDIVLFFVFLLFLQSGEFSIEYIRTFMFAALGTDSLFYIFSLRSLDRSVFATNPFQNRYLIAAILLGFVMMGAAIYAPVMNVVLETEPLQPIHLVWVALLGVYKIFLVELVKWSLRGREPKEPLIMAPTGTA